MKNTLILAAGLIKIGSGLPYIFDILRDKTHPNLVTWFTWMLLVAISAAAAFSAGAWQTGIFTAAGALVYAAIVILSLSRGIKKYTRFDVVCQVLAIVGLILWRITGNPAVAIAISLVVVTVAALPTWRHAWVAPFAETWQAFGLAGVAAVLTIVSLTSYSFVSLAFPMAAILNCTILVPIILLRRRRSAQPGAANA